MEVRASALACAALPLRLHSCGWEAWEGVCVTRCRQEGSAAEGRVASTPGGLTRSSPTLGGGNAQGATTW